MTEPIFYRLGVGIILINKKNKIFMARRVDNPKGHWQMPQGGLNDSEEPIEAALRELKEEIGTDHVKILKESRNLYRYDFPDNLAHILWQGHYRGQEQKWFLMQFLGKDEEINLKTEHPEFIEWKWVTLEELTDLVIPFKKPLYESLIKEFFQE